MNPRPLVMGMSGAASLGCGRGLAWAGSLAIAACLASAGCRGTGAPAGPQPVLFVCEHGAAKSVIAATYFNQLATARGLAVRATARGADPQRSASVPTMAGLQ